MNRKPAREKSDSLLSQTRRLLRRADLRARKGLGQHFLVDSEVLDKIIDAAGLVPTDTVIEVGPGLGVLTRELAGRAGWVIAIELDSKLAAVLKKTLSPFDNVVILNEDILGTDDRKQKGFQVAVKGGKKHIPPGLDQCFTCRDYRGRIGYVLQQLQTGNDIESIRMGFSKLFSGGLLIIHLKAGFL